MSAFTPTVRTVCAAIEVRLATDPDAPLLRCGAGWWTTAQLDEVSDRVAVGLTDFGVRQGDRVAMMCSNREEYFALFFAVAKLGAILVPVNPYLRGPFLAHQLTDSGALVAIADADGHRQITTALAVGAKPRFVLLGEVEEMPSAAIAWGDLTAASGAVPRAAVDAGDVLAIIYTSGTTGAAKGCMLSHGYYSYFAAPWAQRGWVLPGDRVFTALPLFHTGGHLAIMFALMLAGTSTCFATSFSASTYMADAAAVDATCLFGIGVHASAILQQPERADDGRHPFRIAGFPPLRPEDQDGFERRFATPVIAEGIGQTEITPGLLESVSGPRRRGANGRPCDHVDVDLVDGDGQSVAVGEVGELMVRPRVEHVLFSGYWNRPDATAQAWNGEWFRTGDYFRRDDTGFYEFVDRRSDFLRRRGENISSVQLEAAIAQHPGIAQVAVCAVQSDLSDIELKACIVPHAGTSIDERNLFAFFTENLPYFAVPRYVEFRDGLPTTDATNRVQKALLRAEGITERTRDLQALGMVISRADRRR